eukprot:gene31067-40002_t
MKPWIKKTLMGIVGASIAVGGLTACSSGHHQRGPMTAEKMAEVRGKMVDRVSSKLDLDRKSDTSYLDRPGALLIPSTCSRVCHRSDPAQLSEELRSLIWLSSVLNRSLIVPNLLGQEALHTVPKWRGRSLWPGFRQVFLNRGATLPIQILEPAFYWRIRKDFSAGQAPVPEPI